MSEVYTGMPMYETILAEIEVENRSTAKAEAKAAKEMGFAAACEGKDVKAVLPKRTVKVNTEKTVSALDALKIVLENLHEYDDSSLDALKAGLELLAKSEDAVPQKKTA